MEFEIVTICIVLVFVAYIAGRVGYAIGNDKKEESDYDKMNDAVDDALKKKTIRHATY